MMNCECNKRHEVERIYLVPFYCITLRNMLNEKIDINLNETFYVIMKCYLNIKYFVGK